MTLNGDVHVVDHASHAMSCTICMYYVCMYVSIYVCRNTLSMYLSRFCACVQASGLVHARIEKVGSDHQH